MSIVLGATVEETFYVEIPEFTRADFCFLGVDNIFTGSNTFIGNTTIYNLTIVNQSVINVNDTILINGTSIFDLFSNDTDTNETPRVNALYNNISLFLFDTNATTECANGYYLDGDGICYSFNDSVKTLFADEHVIYNATKIVTETGTLYSGNLASIQTLGDDDTYNVSEVSGTPGFMIYANFTDISAFNVMALRGKYIGGAGHTVALEIYRVGVGWEEREEITDQMDYGVTTVDIFIGADFIDGSGTVQVRMNHDESGNINHDQAIDYWVLAQAPGLVTGGDLADLTGRDNACVLLPGVFCKDGSKNMTGPLNGTNALFTGNITTPGIVNTPQINDAATDILGINKAAVSGIGIDYTNTHSTANTAGIGQKMDINFAQDDNADILNQGLVFDVDITGTDTGDFGIGKDTYGMDFSVTDSSTLNAEFNTHTTKGINVNVNYDGTPTQTRTFTIMGADIVVGGAMGEGTAGYAAEHYGQRVQVNGAADTNFGIWVSSGNAAINWAFYNNAGEMRMGLDNNKTYWGTGNDVSTYFNSTAWVFNPREVGNGDGWLMNDWHVTEDLDVGGNVTADYYLGSANVTNGMYVFTNGTTVLGYVGGLA